MTVETATYPIRQFKTVVIDGGKSHRCPSANISMSFAIMSKRSCTLKVFGS